MGFRGLVGSFVHAAARRGGYRIYKQSMLPWGVDHIFDIKRLCEFYGYPIHTIFDVGANAGQAAGVFLEAFPSALVHSFEPHPVTFAKLISSCRDTRFHAHNLALGSERGESDFYDYGEAESLLNSMNAESAFTRRYGRKAERIRVAVETLDGFCAKGNLESVDLLKIDTEGFERSVLQGAENLLGAGLIKFVYFEFNSVVQEADGRGTSLIECDRFLKACGYQFVAAYTDWLDPSGELFAVRNALYVH